MAPSGYTTWYWLLFPEVFEVVCTFTSTVLGIFLFERERPAGKLVWFACGLAIISSGAVCWSNMIDYGLRRWLDIMILDPTPTLIAFWKIFLPVVLLVLHAVLLWTLLRKRKERPTARIPLVKFLCLSCIASAVGIIVADFIYSAKVS